MDIPIKHSQKCRASFPQCPCNTCTEDVVGDDGGVCCLKRAKKCEQSCPDYIDEREVRGT